MQRTTTRSLLALLFLWLGQGCGQAPAPAQDGGTDDATMDERRCDSDDDCDDGVFCNGLEECVAGACAPGAPPSCDDGDACTTDACSAEDDACVNAPVDADRDGHVAASCGGDDCDDSDPLRFPGNTEICDAEHRDEDCDPSTFGERDQDGDGAFDLRCCNAQPGGGAPRCGTDCDDVRASVAPGSVEACDGFDNDCDGLVDEEVAVSGFADEDGDLHGDPARPLSSCAGMRGFSTVGDDCDDTNPARHGAQVEVCDGVDNDCDGVIDEDARAVSWYLDTDGDGFGDPTSPVVVSCAPVPSRSLLGTDCDDTDGAVHPAAAEACNGIDDDCNGVADFRVGPGDLEDDDGDGVLDAACGAGGDCDDRNAQIGAGFSEICDGQDNDCDGTVDEETIQAVWFADRDGDGFGSSVSGAVVSCVAVSGHSLRGGDCDDYDDRIRPGAVELCNGIDDDCDGAVDDGVWRACGLDVGVCSVGLEVCLGGLWSACSGAPATTETCNGLDDDCDGAVDEGC